MRAVTLQIGFIPLVDAAPLIVAEAMGFAAEEGLSLDLRRAPSWSTIRDMLSFGRIEAAHLLSPIPVAQALGLGGGGTRLDAVSVLSVNGNTIAVSRALAGRIRDAGHDFGFGPGDAAAAGRAVIAASRGRLRVGVPFPFSMHAELVYYWLSALGLPSPQSLDVRTIPPPLMSSAIRDDTIDAFCVGEPWGSGAVAEGVADLLLPGSAIWAFAPEKVLAMRSDWAAAEPVLRDRLVRAVWRAGRWLSDPASHTVAAELLSRPGHLNLSAEIIERALSGRLVISPTGEERHVPGFMVFHEGAAGFPWRSQAEWIGGRLAARTGLDVRGAMELSRQCFRSDVFRSALEPTSADLPTTDTRIEGGLGAHTPTPSRFGRLRLLRNSFFDGRQFPPGTS